MMKNATIQHRLVWVDLAKAVAIIAMILGHEVDGTSLHTWIFSFHMPIFFILSGYTSHLVTSWKDWRQQMRKLAVRILIPALLMIVIYQIERSLFKQISWEQVLPISSKELIWGAAPAASMQGLSIEIEWFLFVYFFAKLFFDCLNIIFKDQRYGTVLVLLSFACYQFITVHMNLPLALDLVPLASLYMYIGHLLKSKEEWLGTHYFFIVALAFVFWGLMLINQQYVDMAKRWFTGNYILGILETIAGSFVIIVACQEMDQFKLMEKLALLGKHTLLLMFIHELDCYNLTITDIVRTWHLNCYASGLYRFTIDFLAMLVILWGMKCFRLLNIGKESSL